MLVKVASACEVCRYRHTQLHDYLTTVVVHTLVQNKNQLDSSSFLFIFIRRVRVCS